MKEIRQSRGMAPRGQPEFAPALVELEDLSHGGFILRSPTPLRPYTANLCLNLIEWAEQEPDRTFLAEREAQGNWRELSYSDALKCVRSLAEALLRRGVTQDRPVMILSGNSIESGLLQLGAMYIGVPVIPVSAAYSLMSEDFGKLKYVFDLIRPKLVFAYDGGMFSKALQTLDLGDAELVIKQNEPRGLDCISFESLTEAIPSDDISEALSRVGPDTVAKILFTSGSTGPPKGVINTQRMMCSNQEAMRQVWPFLTRQPPVLLDWLPWSHTFGGNHNFNMILRNGGTLYIDAGKPAPGLIETTIANLGDVSPTAYFNVPRGFDMIVPFLERDEVLRDKFFSRLDIIFYAAAALPQDLWERLEKLSFEARGKKVAMTSAWGATETAPLATSVHFPIDRAGIIGLPVPGCEIKMVPLGGKLEMRVRGPNVTPGYYKRENLFRETLDEDGFYRTGDAGKLADPDDPRKGLVFDGRLAEDFKLSTGTWVSVGRIRVDVVTFGAPLIQDAVITGHDRDEVGLLVFLNAAETIRYLGFELSMPLDVLAENDAVRETLRQKLLVYNRDHPGSASRIGRALVLAEPPNTDANEITDKGYINQRAVLERRSNLVERLYTADREVIIVAERP